ncbi:MAG: hypothetical protein ACE5JB_14655, partial [bacterium]
ENLVVEKVYKTMYIFILAQWSHNSIKAIARNSNSSQQIETTQRMEKLKNIRWKYILGVILLHKKQRFV